MAHVLDEGVAELLRINCAFACLLDAIHRCEKMSVLDLASASTGASSHDESGIDSGALADRLVQPVSGTIGALVQDKSSHRCSEGRFCQDSLVPDVAATWSQDEGVLMKCDCALDVLDHPVQDLKLVITFLKENSSVLTHLGSGPWSALWSP